MFRLFEPVTHATHGLSGENMWMTLPWTCWTGLRDTVLRFVLSAYSRIGIALGIGDGGIILVSPGRNVMFGLFPAKTTEAKTQSLFFTITSAARWGRGRKIAAAVWGKKAAVTSDPGWGSDHVTRERRDSSLLS